MADTNRSITESTGDELVITRAFDAPRDRVFRAWTRPEDVMQWWGPGGFTMPLCKIDARPGGVFQYCMRSPDGRDYCGRGVYREVVEPERIVYIDSFADQEGNPVPATYYGMSSSWPEQMLITVTLAEEDGKTRLTLRSPDVVGAGKERDDAVQGWTESLGRLADHLAQA